MFEGFRGGTTQIRLENEDMGGGSRKSSNVIRGGINSVKQHSKGGSAKFHLVYPRILRNEAQIIFSCACTFVALISSPPRRVAPTHERLATVYACCILRTVVVFTIVGDCKAETMIHSINSQYGASFRTITNSPRTYRGLRQDVTQLTEKFLFALIDCSKFVDLPHASFRTSVNPSDFFAVQSNTCTSKKKP